MAVPAVKHLIEGGNHHIRIIDNLSVGKREDLTQICDFTELDFSQLINLSNEKPQSTKVELVIGDILNPELSLLVTKGIDVIIHLAANTGVISSVNNPRLDCETNIIGTFNYLEGARYNNVKRFIFASSGAPVGECTPPIHEEMAPHPVSPYGASKLAGEAHCSAYYRTFGVETIALRFGNVYGPLSGHKNSVVAKFIKQAINKEICQIYGDGTQTRDFIYIDDLIQAVLKAARADIGGEILQIASNREHTVNEIVNILKTEFQQFHGIKFQVKYSQPRLGEVQRNYSDTSKAKKLLGWQSNTTLPEGLKKTIKWFISQS